MNADLANEIRVAMLKVRRSDMPLRDLIPLMQRAADALDSSTTIAPREMPAQSLDYSSAILVMLDRDAQKEKRYMVYPVTRVELMEFDGDSITPKRIFVVDSDAHWIEQQ